MWEKAHAVYHRSSKGGGEWEYRKKFPAEWNIGYDNMTFKVTPTGFKHTGIFPEQSINWDFIGAGNKKLTSDNLNKVFPFSIPSFKDKNKKIKIIAKNIDLYITTFFSDS